jgi:hypothetical protein
MSLALLAGNRAHGIARVLRDFGVYRHLALRQGDEQSVDGYYEYGFAHFLLGSPLTSWWPTVALVTGHASPGFLPAVLHVQCQPMSSHGHLMVAVVLSPGQTAQHIPRVVRREHRRRGSDHGADLVVHGLALGCLDGFVQRGAPLGIGRARRRVVGRQRNRGVLLQVCEFLVNTVSPYPPLLATVGSFGGRDTDCDGGRSWRLQRGTWRHPWRGRPLKRNGQLISSHRDAKARTRLARTRVVRRQRAVGGTCQALVNTGLL